MWQQDPSRRAAFFNSIFLNFCDLKDEPCFLALRKDRPFLYDSLSPGWLHNKVVGQIML